MIIEHNNILCGRGRLTKIVILASQRLTKGHTRESDLESCLYKNRAESTDSAHKRTRDGAFGSYLIYEHNDILCARGRLTKIVILAPNVSQAGTLVNLY